jgi:hypothetical protein
MKLSAGIPSLLHETIPVNALLCFHETLVNTQILSRYDYSYGGVIRKLSPEFVGDSPRGHCVYA